LVIAIGGRLKFVGSAGHCPSFTNKIKLLFLVQDVLADLLSAGWISSA